MKSCENTGSTHNCFYEQLPSALLCNQGGGDDFCFLDQALLGLGLLLRTGRSHAEMPGYLPLGSAATPKRIQGLAAHGRQCRKCCGSRGNTSMAVAFERPHARMQVHNVPALRMMHATVSTCNAPTRSACAHPQARPCASASAVTWCTDLAHIMST